MCVREPHRSLLLPRGVSAPHESRGRSSSCRTHSLAAMGGLQEPREMAAKVGQDQDPSIQPQPPWTVAGQRPQGQGMRGRTSPGTLRAGMGARSGAASQAGDPGRRAEEAGGRDEPSRGSCPLPALFSPKQTERRPLPPHVMTPWRRSLIFPGEWPEQGAPPVGAAHRGTAASE